MADQMDYTESGFTQNQTPSGRDQKQPPTQNQAPDTQDTPSGYNSGYNSGVPSAAQNNTTQSEDVEMSDEDPSTDYVVITQQPDRIHRPDQTEQNQDQKGTSDLGGFPLQVLSAAQISSSLSDDPSKATDIQQTNRPSRGASAEPDLYTSGDHVSPASDTHQELYRSAKDTQTPPATAHVTQTSSSGSKSSDTKQKNHSNTQKKEATDNSVPEPSAPQDVKMFYMTLDWTEDLPEKLGIELEKALQTWCSKQPSKVSVTEFRLLEDGLTAQGRITPSTALNGIKSANIKSKHLQEVTVYFHDEKPKSGDKGSFPKVNMTDKETTQSEVMKKEEGASPFKVHTEMTGASQTFTMSTFQYWYLSQAYKKEMEQIEKMFGVQIKAETSVDISAEAVNKKTESDSISRAQEAFSDLVKEANQNFKTINVPLTHMESKNMKDVLCQIPTQKNKLMLNMTANTYLLSGPENLISALEKQLKVDPGVEPAKWTPKNFDIKLEMDIKDTQAPLEMDETYFNLMNKVFTEQLSEIQHKYGVQFDFPHVQDTVKVTVRSSGTHQFNLEAYALRALTQLYQKVVTSAVICDVKDFLTQKVPEAFQRIQSQHASVCGGERNGSWQLFGLPKHLVPAIADIEKIIGHPVFDDKTKQFLGYPSDFTQTRGFQRGQMEMDVMGGAHGTNLEGGTEAKNFPFSQHTSKIENGKEKENEDRCPICLDTFIEKTKLSCGHEFCKGCHQLSVKSNGEICPICKKIFGTLKGTQPRGNMNVHFSSSSLPGFDGFGMIEITYDIPGGTQTNEHPNPGKRYYGTHRTAYLPNNADGNHVLKLLKRAFDQKLIFTVGFSRTTGAEDAVTWNDIHHKTSISGGPECFGYPDPHYLDRVKEELKAKGIE